ncbi:hypothetical protein X801_03785, partial [Opisthorchis viverrini]
MNSTYYVRLHACLSVQSALGIRTAQRIASSRDHYPMQTHSNFHHLDSNAHAAPSHSHNMSRLEAVDFHVHPDCNSSMLSVQPVSSASTPAGSYHSRTKPCHRFRVAALTDETDITSQEGVGDEFNSKENSVKYPPHFGDKRPISKRPKQRHSGSRRSLSDNSSPQPRDCDPLSLHDAGDPIISTAFFPVFHAFTTVH